MDKGNALEYERADISICTIGKKKWRTRLLKLLDRSRNDTWKDKR